MSKNAEVYEAGKKAGKAWNGKQKDRPENPHKYASSAYRAFEDGFADGAHPSEARSKNPYLKESKFDAYINEEAVKTVAIRDDFHNSYKLPKSLENKFNNQLDKLMVWQDNTLQFPSRKKTFLKVWNQYRD